MDSHKKALIAATPELKCTGTTSCWCNEVSHRFPHVQANECMSPQEMLCEFGHVLSVADVAYLSKLTRYNFAP